MKFNNCLFIPPPPPTPHPLPCYQSCKSWNIPDFPSIIPQPNSCTHPDNRSLSPSQFLCTHRSCCSGGPCCPLQLLDSLTILSNWCNTWSLPWKTFSLGSPQHCAGLAPSPENVLHKWWLLWLHYLALFDQDLNISLAPEWFKLFEDWHHVLLV